jgi:hypothetical protein
LWGAPCKLGAHDLTMLSRVAGEVGRW